MEKRHSQSHKLATSRQGRVAVQPTVPKKRRTLSYSTHQKKPGPGFKSVAKVRLTNGFEVIGYIPGKTRNPEHSVVMIEDGFIKYYPGIRQRVIQIPKRRPSKHGAKRPKSEAESESKLIKQGVESEQNPSFPVVRATTSSLERLSSYTADEIYSLVVPKRTLARREANNELLTIEETDKALRLDRIARLAEKVFGNAEKAGRWLRKPKRSLDGESPLVYLASEAGARIVEDMLIQIDSGIVP